MQQHLCVPLILSSLATVACSTAPSGEAHPTTLNPALFTYADSTHAVTLFIRAHDVDGPVTINCSGGLTKPASFPISASGMDSASAQINLVGFSRALGVVGDVDCITQQSGSTSAWSFVLDIAPTTDSVPVIDSVEIRQATGTVLGVSVDVHDDWWLQEVTFQHAPTQSCPCSSDLLPLDQGRSMSFSGIFGVPGPGQYWFRLYLEDDGGQSAEAWFGPYAVQ